MVRFIAFVSIAILGFGSAVIAADDASRPQTETCYPDKFGEKNGTCDLDNPCLNAEVCFGLGDKSWADEVVELKPGCPVFSDYQERKESVLGPKKHGNTTQIGRGGSIILAFNDGELANRAGPDIWIFDRGQNKEPVLVSIRKNSESDWISLGTTTPGRTAIDLATNAGSAGTRFSHLLLVDPNEKSDDETCLVEPNNQHFDGVDLQAVGANICRISFTSDSFAFFETGESDLSEENAKRLNPVVELLVETDSVKVHIDGFADHRGSEEYNKKLSEKRAQAIRALLQKATDRANKTVDYIIEAKGELPAPTEGSNLQADRRVEITVLPVGDNACAK